MTSEDLQKRISEAKEGAVDLTSEEDLALGVMNLIASEEHLFFTYEKTKKKEYLKSLNSIRDLRKVLMARMIPQYEGELWCTCKHLLSATMRLSEVGTKALGQGDTKGAKEAFDHAYFVFNVFWGLRLKIIDLPAVDHVKSGGITLGDIMSQAINCCDE